MALRTALMASLAAAALGAAPALAAGERQIDLPAGTLDGALKALAAQTGDQLLYDTAALAGRRVPALRGRFTAEGALQRLLGASDVAVVRAGPKVLVLKVRSPPTATSADTRPPASGPARPFADARPAAETTPAPAAGDAREESLSSPVRHAPTLVDEVRVTGSHIRGGSPAAPVLVIDRAALERSGHATIAGALQALPQNFGGESTDSTAGAVRADRLSTNSGYATGVNLRGLGSDSTLVLVNGRRMAGSGNKGDFTDLSTLPAIAVERVEILLDGASALYGSDAVGGVVNVILRRNFEGGEIRVRAGTGEHGPHEGLVGTAFGHTWASGSVLLAYEGYRRDALPSSARRFTQSADLRPLGGSDWRDTFSYPGNILRVDPATGVSGPYWAIPAGQPGTGLRPADFQAGTVNLFNQNAGIDVLPDQRRHSAYLALRQALTPKIEISGDVRYGARKVKAATNGATSTFTVGRNNPFFVSPNGAASNQIRYSFGGAAGPRFTHVGVDSLATSLGLDAQLPRDWRLNVYGAFAREIVENTQSEGVHSLILAEALGNAPDNPATAYNAARDGYFNPFAATPAGNSPVTLAAITSGFSKARYRSEVRSANAQADGSLFDLPGGAVKLALGGQVRREAFRSQPTNYSSTVAPVISAGFNGHREVAAAFGELRIPLVGPDNRRPGIESLEISAAVRAEHYSDFGRTVNPRLGAIWSPAAGLRVRATYGESFRAPALTELYGTQLYSPVDTAVNGATLLTLGLQGGNPDLGPETATSWTLGFDLEPAAIPGLQVSATWFETDFDARIDRPLMSAPRNSLLTDPRLAPFVQRISPGSNTADLALINALLASPLNNSSFGVFPGTAFSAITDFRYVNTAGLKVRGLDVQGAYGFDGLGGHVALAASASWMLDYKQALTPTSPFTELAGQVAYPVTFRSRLTADWTREAFGLGAAVNHLSGARDGLGARIKGQTTVDLQGRYVAPADGWGRGVTVALSVRNVFDKAPPFYDNSIGLGFDATNADVIGRFASITLSRSW